MPANRFDRTAYDSAFEAESRQSSSEAENGPEALRRLQQQLEELANLARLFVAAKKDAIVATLRKLALWGAAAMVLAVVAVTMLVTAAVLMLVGLAEGIGLALGGHLWAGYLMVGSGLLLSVMLGLVAALRTLQNRFRKDTVKRYAKWHETQRIRSGRHSPQRPSASPAGEAGGGTASAERN